MTADDVTATLKLALEASRRFNLANAFVHHERRGCSATTARPISPAIWVNGSRTTVWITFGAHRITRKPRAAIERWHQTLKNRILLENSIIYRGDRSKTRSAPSSITTTTNATTRAIGNVPLIADAYFGRSRRTRRAIQEKRKKIRGKP